MKIVLFSDGTGNSSAKAEKTNVWRLFQALDQKRADVRAMYDDGVGTASNKYLALLGGAFGWGLKRNVLDLYKFVCKNYRPGSEIYGFGFSRGAYTIRVLVSLIATEGLVPFRTESELDRNAKLAYRHYRAERFPSKSPFIFVTRWLRDAALAVWDWLSGYRPYGALKFETDWKSLAQRPNDRTYSRLETATKSEGRRRIPIRFLGLWDSVDAYGMPVQELKWGIDQVLWPMMFDNCVLSPIVERACHALSLDDERMTFHPLIWDEEKEAEMVQQGKVVPGRITQVWFAGVHSDVGGGYPEDQLSLVPLAWMMNQAMANDLPLDRECMERVNEEKSPYARIYDSRHGFAAYYRYAPRTVPIRTYDGDEILPIVHGSVIMRMAFGSDRYAPITLPDRFWVLAPDGALLPMEGFGGARPDRTKKAAGVPAAAPSAVKSSDTVKREREDLERVVAGLGAPDRAAVEIVRDTVWCRQLFYFLTLGLTLLLVAYPRIQDWIGIELVERSSEVPRGVIAELMSAVGSFVPSYFSSWTDALQKHPIEFLSLVLALAWCLYIGRLLKSHIADRARLAWHRASVTDYLGWLRGEYKGWCRLMLIGFGVSLAAVFILRFTGCDATVPGVLSGIFFVLFLWRLWQVVKSARWGNSSAANTLPSSLALRIARVMRSSSVSKKLYHRIFEVAIPIAFASALLVIGIFVAHRALFDAFDGAGAFCDGSDAVEKHEELKSTGEFSTSARCWNTGAVLVAGRRYRITLYTEGDWFDKAIRTDVEGFRTEGWRHYAAALMRRWWSENWFKPIARIGRRGDDQYPLDAIDKFEEHTYCRHPEQYGGKDSTIKQKSIWIATQKQIEACTRCARKEPQTDDKSGSLVDKIESKITDGSRKDLLDCSPTPGERKKLVAEIGARTTGELFIYVNDAIVMVPGYVDIFYRNNSGTARVVVERASSAAGVAPEVQRGDDASSQR